MTAQVNDSMPSKTYHDDPCETPSLSNSIAQILLAKSPLHAWAAHPKLGNVEREKGEDDKFDYGSACHDILLEGGDKVAVINPDDYPSKTGSIPKGWTNDAIRAAREEARDKGKIPVLPRQEMKLSAMVTIAREFIADSEIGEYWQKGKSEVTVTWKEKGIWLRCRMDRLSDDLRFIGDYKSTYDAAPESFSRHIARMGYHIQDAFYRRAIRAMGSDDPVFVFVAQEVSAPYACSLHACDPAMREIGDTMVERAIDAWAECLKTGVWPGYDQRIHWAAPTSWQMAEFEEELQHTKGDEE